MKMNLNLKWKIEKKKRISPRTLHSNLFSTNSIIVYTENHDNENTGIQFTGSISNCVQFFVPFFHCLLFHNNYINIIFSNK